MKALFVTKVATDQCVFALVEAFARQAHRDFFVLPLWRFKESLGSDLTCEYLRRTIRGFSPDLVIVVNFAATVIPAEEWKDLIHTLSSPDYIFVAVDDPFILETRKEFHLSYATQFDLVVTCDPRGVIKQEYLDAGAKRVIFFPPPAPLSFIEYAEKKSHFRVSKVTPRPLYLYGTNTYSRPPYSSPQTLSRVQICKAISEEIRVNLYGPDSFTSEFAELPQVTTHGFLPYKNIPRTVAGKVLLTPSVRPTANVPARFLEACACGALMVTELSEFSRRIGRDDEEKNLVRQLFYEIGSLEGCKQAILTASKMEYKDAMKISGALLAFAREWNFERMLGEMQAALRH